MGGNFNLDKAHGDVGSHLDHIQYGEFGSIHERFDATGRLIDTRFRFSNSLANELGVNPGPYPLGGIGSGLPPVSG